MDTRKIAIGIIILLLLLPAVSFSETIKKKTKENPEKRTGKIPDGIVKEYYESGKLSTEKNYKDNKLDGKLYLDQDYPEEEVFTDEGIKQGLSDTLRTSFFKTGKFTVLERTKMDEILKEQKFQLTGCTTTECAVEIGKILNVNYIVVGSVSKIGKEYVLNIRIVDVESSEVVIADMERSDSEKELIDAIDKLVVSIGNRMVFKDDNTKLKSIAVLDVDVK